MVRPLRPDYVNTYHHVVVRGVDGLPIFDSPEKRDKFLRIIKETRQFHDLKIYAFGFMDNHWHAFVRRAGIAMARFFQTVKSRYTIWYNKIYGRTGTLYDSRYFSSTVEAESYFQMVWHYVQNQGIKAGIYKTAVEDPGSTAGWYSGVSDKYGWIDWKEALETLNIPAGTSGGELTLKMKQMNSPDKLPMRRARDQYFIASDQYVEEYMQIRKQKVRSKSREESPLSWKKLLEGVEELFGCAAETILTPTKERKYSRIRAGLAYVARRYGHKPSKEIAVKLSVSNPTVSRMIKRVCENYISIKSKWDNWIQSEKRKS
jgi:REP element-mobilizing transposase RayT